MAPGSTIVRPVNPQVVVPANLFHTAVTPRTKEVRHEMYTGSVSKLLTGSVGAGHASEVQNCEEIVWTRVPV